MPLNDSSSTDDDTSARQCDYIHYLIGNGYHSQWKADQSILDSVSICTCFTGQRACLSNWRSSEKLHNEVHLSKHIGNPAF